MNPRHAFFACLERSPPALFEAALWIAAEHDPTVQPLLILQELNVLQQQVSLGMPLLPADELGQPLLRRLKADLAPARHNGASFLGLQGIVVKSHGAAGQESFQSAIRCALREVQENLPQRLHGRLEDLLL